MSEYTPTTEEVRNRFTFYSSGIPHPEFEAEFNRWLDNVTRYAWARGYNEGYSTGEKRFKADS